MIFNGINYEKLSYLKQYFTDPVTGIPSDPGVYYWVYWPEFDPATISIIDLEKKLIDYSSKNLQFPEEVTGTYKFIAEVKEQKFDKNSSPLFGLSPSRRLEFLNYLTTPANVVNFAAFFQEICFARPFYVGKANNLRSRLVNFHFQSKTDVVPEILKQGISEAQIWVGYKIIPMNASDQMNRIFEEIISRNIKPGLTKKPN